MNVSGLRREGRADRASPYSLYPLDVPGTLETAPGWAVDTRSSGMIVLILNGGFVAVESWKGEMDEGAGVDATSGVSPGGLSDEPHKCQPWWLDPTGTCPSTSNSLPSAQGDY